MSERLDLGNGIDVDPRRRRQVGPGATHPGVGRPHVPCTAVLVSQAEHEMMVIERPVHATLLVPHPDGELDPRLPIEERPNALAILGGHFERRRIEPVAHQLFCPWPMLRTARNASCGTSTAPTCFIRFLPAFCFSSSFRLRVMSPP